MLLASWNVNGLRAASERGLCDWLADFGPDVVLLQEVKARADDLPMFVRCAGGYRLRVVPAQRRGYSGVGIYTRREPDEWIVGFGDPPHDREGRLLSARFGDLVVTSVYFPNSRPEGARLRYRLRFGARVACFLDAQRAAGRTVVIGGDFNVAHRPIDLARPRQNERNPGYLPQERRWMESFLGAGWVDTWRALNPQRAGVYSWWSFRHDARRKNIGWRLDYFCIDERSWPRVAGAEILTGVAGSDHCPVALELGPVRRAARRPRRSGRGA